VVSWVVCQGTERSLGKFKAHTPSIASEFRDKPSDNKEEGQELILPQQRLRSLMHFAGAVCPEVETCELGVQDNDVRRAPSAGGAIT
jgi:hypothetical protein